MQLCNWKQNTQTEIWPCNRSGETITVTGELLIPVWLDCALSLLETYISFSRPPFPSILYYGHIPYRPQTISGPAKKHDHMGHKVYHIGHNHIRGGFCRRVLLSVSQLFRGLLFRMFMTKIKGIKICWKVRSCGRLKCETWKCRIGKYGTNRSLVKCVIVECGQSKAESKPADLTVE